jgi:SGNH domain (fused to AT3 domains)
MLQIALRNPEISTVVLSSRWSNWRVGVASTPAETQYDIRLRDQDGLAGSLSDNRLIFAHGFQLLIEKLRAAGKHVWIVGPTPEPVVDVPKAIYIKSIGLDSTSLDISEADYESRNRFILDLFKDIAAKYPVQFVWPVDALCESNRCAVEEHGEPLYFDNNHLSSVGVSKISLFYDPIWKTL